MELAVFRIVIASPRLAISFDHMDHLSPLHFSFIFVSSMVVSSSSLLPALLIPKPSLSPGHLFCSKYDRTTGIVCFSHHVQRFLYNGFTHMSINSSVISLKLKPGKPSQFRKSFKGLFLLVMKMGLYWHLLLDHVLLY